MEQAKQVVDDIDYCDGPYSCAENADALVVVTEWEQFRALDFDRMKQVMASADRSEKCLSVRRTDALRIHLPQHRQAVGSAGNDKIGGCGVTPCVLHR
jgi:hypothetical protein